MISQSLCADGIPLSGADYGHLEFYLLEFFLLILRIPAKFLLGRLVVCLESLPKLKKAVNIALRLLPGWLILKAPSLLSVERLVDLIEPVLTALLVIKPAF
ncbi:MAG: hypothetical protein J1E95_10435, partial [Muribaculaceae bacterium]|nr:hypothetical protein [Muribaculaceae bacterium]